MTLVLGVDPGSSGALVVYCSDSKRIVSCEDTPLWYQTVGKRKRKRYDAIALAEMFDTFEMMDVELVVMEAVGGRTGQGAAAGFQFGYGVGLLYMCAIYSRIVIETVPPATWKKLLDVPGKSKADDTAILKRADELFPHDRALFRGPKGGKKIDRAEAAMLAKFGAERILEHVDREDGAERKNAYHTADTGA